MIYKYLIIGIVILCLTTYIGYLRYTNASLENENKDLTVSLDIAKQELEKSQNALRKSQQYSKELSNIVNTEKLKAQDLQSKLSKLEKSFSKIASRHPEMLNKILNKATKEVKDCFEILSKGGECEN